MRLRLRRQSEVTKSESGSLPLSRCQLWHTLAATSNRRGFFATTHRKHYRLVTKEIVFTPAYHYNGVTFSPRSLKPLDVGSRLFFANAKITFGEEDIARGSHQTQVVHLAARPRSR
jgi:hypothetical protein